MNDKVPKSYIRKIDRAKGNEFLSHSNVIAMKHLMLAIANQNEDERGCTLHLRSYTELRNPDSFSFSSAVDNVGDYLITWAIVLS
ncbi:24439_t:CDS:2 [Gigaspora rosea]|nr:24439_t:CDS:2 [Gigaspora rosea]